MATDTIGDRLHNARLDTLAEVLKLVDLKALLTVQEWDTGTISASSTITPPGGCLLVQSIHVVTSATAGSVGHYLPGNSTSTPLLPPGGANVAVGIATVSADGVTITLPNTITRAIVRYIRKPATALTDAYSIM